MGRGNWADGGTPERPVLGPFGEDLVDENAVAVPVGGEGDRVDRVGPGAQLVPPFTHRRRWTRRRRRHQPLFPFLVQLGRREAASRHRYHPGAQLYLEPHPKK